MNSKPLTTSLGDSIRDKLGLPPPEQERRLAPPSVRPPPTYTPPAQTHALAPPREPERAYVDNGEPVDAAEDDRRRRTYYTKEFKAHAVSIVLERRARGDTLTQTAAALGVLDSTLSSWVTAAQEETARAAGSSGAADSLVSVSRELAEAIERVARLKRKLKALLEDA